MAQRYLKHDRVSLKSHLELSEKWVQTIIADDPSIVGLGDLVLIQQERIQPRAGRLDLLLQERESKRRYECELQLGATDEAHIIRAIEYWDIEKKRYPQYEHCAVIIAEDVTSRFLNVIQLFNGSVPLIAIQMQALQVGDGIALVFTKVVDQMTRGPVDVDEDAEAAPTDRAYWERAATKATVSLVDELMPLVAQLDPELKPNYNKFYIGLMREGVAFNFLLFRPKKKLLKVDTRLPQSEDTTSLIEGAGFDLLDYDSRYTSYRIQLTRADVEQKRDVLSLLFRQAFQARSG